MSRVGGDGQRAFERLKPLCTQLLEVSANSPEERAVVLDALQRVLKDIDPAGLQKCMDYVLFPLLLLLDAAVSTRTSSVRDTNAVKARQMVIPDRVAERTLSCVEVVLQRCTLETNQQMTMMLRKLTGAAMLTASEAAEEFRHGVVKCLKALLTNLSSCSSGLCTCQSVSPSRFEMLKQTTRKSAESFEIPSSKFEASMSEKDICPLGLLQMESMAPAVGHLISLLLQIAEAEAGRGGVGSGKLRRDALSTLRLLILKVGSADALAYFLPGVVRGFATAMRFTKAQVNSGFATPIVHVSGAAGWPAVVEEAVRGMAEILSLVLGDEVNRFISSDPTSTSIEEDATLDVALDYLKDLALQSGRRDKNAVATHETTEAEAKTSTLVVHQSQDQDHGVGVNPLRVERSKKWLSETTARVQTFLSQTLPLLCAHQSSSVRLAVAESTAVILGNCTRTMEAVSSLLLECLLALACDDFTHVASSAQGHLSRLTGSRGLLWLNDGADVHLPIVKVSNPLSGVLTDLVSSLVERLPKAIFSANASMTVSHGRRLIAAMYFCGPEGVSSCLLGTPAKREGLVAAMKQCLSFSSAFTGALSRITSKQTSNYPVVSEILQAGSQGDYSPPEQESDAGGVTEKLEPNEIPSMPPWLPVGTGRQLYRVLADVLRLIGLLAVSDLSNDTTLFSLVELLLMDIRVAASSQNMRGSSSTITDAESGQKQRSAATSACLLNEIMYGASGQCSGELFDQFRRPECSESLESTVALIRPDSSNRLLQPEGVDFREEKGAGFEVRQFPDVCTISGNWPEAKKAFVRKVLIECAGGVVHDYMSTEIWDWPSSLPFDSSPSRAPASTNKHQDLVMLQKVLVEGVGVMGIALGKEFKESELLRHVLFPLLEKLSSPSQSVSQAAARSLDAIALSLPLPHGAFLDFMQVRDLVAANLDNVVDFLCRQFRHLNMHPQSLDLLAAILRHTNTAPDLLPLLGEPLHCVVMELDVTARTSRPHLTLPVLRAMREILRAAGSEVEVMLSKATTAAAHWTSITKKSGTDESSAEDHTKVAEKMFEDREMEDHADEFLDRIRQRQAVSKVATSCLVACGPLLASKNPQICLVTLDVISDGISSLAFAEDVRQYEDICRQALEEHCSRMDDAQSSLRCTDAIKKDESEAKNLLPTMNRIWPYLVVCLKHSLTSVVVRALEVMTLVTAKCGGEFFTRRLKNDVVPILATLLSQGLYSAPIKRRSHPLVPLKYTQAPEQGPAALLKTQLAVLRSVGSIAADKKTASALRSTFELIASWVVALACQVEALAETATEATLALSNIDSDFVWILVADILSGTVQEDFGDVALPGFPGSSKILPPWTSPRDCLWCQYANYRGEFKDVNQDLARQLLCKLEGVPTTRRDRVMPA
ncbi:hypothetical protein R1sor_017045 [Riccia sorocarpa]|uniref:Uncharacterized protein n=1 Tax=Riccia sorocarpa TaxID=122646 RepID=A0ABD3I635_9MARC